MATRPDSDDKLGFAIHLDDLLSRDGPAFIRCAYRTLLRREADPGGFVTYLEKLRSGMSKQELIDELRQSEEGRQASVRLSGLESSAKANPRPDNAGFSLEQMLELEGAAFVKQAYLQLLGRSADAEGLAHYSGQLKVGVAKAQILAELTMSDEYVRRGRPVLGVDRIVKRHRHARNPVIRAALRLIGPFRAANVPVDVPSNPLVDVATEVGPLPTPQPPNGIHAQSANPARAWLLTLPTLQERDSKGRV